MRKSIIAILGGIICLILACLLFTSLSNMVNSNRWLKNPSARGKLVDVNGSKIFITVRGEGEPTVIIDVWAGGHSSEWWNIQEEIAKTTRVITYDRAGYGWSDPGKFPRESRQIVFELKSLLDQTGVKGPIVLVGHSIGGLIDQHFTRLYPERVAGVILVDSVSVDNRRWTTDFAKYSKYFDKRPLMKMGRLFFAHLGLLRAFTIQPYQNIPENAKQNVIEQFSMDKAYTAVLSELDQLDQDGIVINSLPKFPDIPLKVLIPDSKSTLAEWKKYKVPEDLAIKMEVLHEKLAKEQLKLSSKSEWIVVERSTHGIHLDRPDIIAEEINKMIKTVRSQTHQ